MSGRDSSSGRRSSRGKRPDEPAKAKPGFKPSPSISAMSEEIGIAGSISKSPSEMFRDGNFPANMQEKVSFHPEEFWDRIAPKYQATIEGRVTEAVSTMLLRSSQIQWKWTPHILDLASGAGSLTAQLVKIPCAKVIAGDVANEFTTATLSALGSNGEAEAFVTSRNLVMTKIDNNKIKSCGSQVFDVVFCNMRLHWFERPRKLLQEVIRVAKPGAEVLFSTWDHRAYNWILPVVLDVINDYARSSFYPYQDSASFGSKDAIRSMLHEAGFVETRMTTREVAFSFTPEEFGELVRHLWVDSVSAWKNTDSL
eukprot:TRINITY_DN5554_c0_g1_i5.p1 TRINITY_DN5554_c0_g1~~TRINITY_DN5554_c0_g1_i5.p1  ORF type:complete len:311 (+),score=47.34 TRINITY_DN5554_c0_g1_i5:92-1024(+)